MSEESVTSNEVSPEVQHEAESQGWVPKERFRGNESDWVDADTFVKRGREILPILRKNNENLIKDLQATKDQIKESRAQAISDGDGQKVNALDDALDQAKENFKEAKQSVKDVVSAKDPEPTPEAIDPGLQVWLDRNTWFGQDKRLTGMVNGIGESLRLEFPLLKGQAFLDKLDEVLAEEFPNKFGKKQSPSSRVESGSGRQSRSGGNAQSYDNLPPEAKSACDRFVKQKLMTREQYVADFDWS